MMIPSQLMENSPIPPHAWTRRVAHGPAENTATANTPTNTHRHLLLIGTSFQGVPPVAARGHLLSTTPGAGARPES